MMRVVDNKLKQMRVRGMQIARVMWTMGTMGAEMVIVEEKGGRDHKGELPYHLH